MFCVVCLACVWTSDLCSCFAWLSGSVMHCFVCKWSSLMKVGKIFPSHFVMSLNKCLEGLPCQLDWSWFEGMLHEVLNLINIPLSRSIANMTWDVWGFRVVSFRWAFKSWFFCFNSKDGPMGVSWRKQCQTWLTQCLLPPLFLHFILLNMPNIYVRFW